MSAIKVPLIVIHLLHSGSNIYFNYLYQFAIIIIIIIKRLLWRQYPRKIRAQWHNKTKGLSILVTMYNAKSRQPMDGGAKKLRRIGHFEKIGFQITAN